MRTKFELKLNIKRLSRQVEECERYERAFVSAQKLCHTGKNTSMYGKLFKRVEDKRTLWWKSLDRKIKLEQTIDLLKERLIKEITEEVL